ncbi:MAG: hypothetical protein BroJett021_04530 [Chloroflexota bacterium]|jgi:predicted small integral membrane protein|nr:hypothetical protein [Caldilinea sp.]GIK71465.1 MAG: hypothetical protein BroJett021_04530 [Chloroflexota bacterium]
MADTKTDSQKLVAPVQHKGRRGFLPIETNTFDRYFISVILWIGVSLLWMRFLEAMIPLWVSTVLCLVLAIIIIRKG